MSITIDKDDKIWVMFIKYCRLIDDHAVNESLDIYGTEHRINMALELTKAHMMDHISCDLKLANKNKTHSNA